jgi:hypothetical protein
MEKLLDRNNRDKEFFKLFEDPQQDGDSDDIFIEDDPPSEERTLMMRVCHYILRLQDNDLKGRYFLRFQKWLMIDKKALQCYVDMSNLCTQLHLIYSNKQFDIKPFEAAISSK